MIVVGLAIVFFFIISYELPALLRKKMWREIIAFFVLLLPGMYIAFALALDWPVPNITKYFDMVFVPLNEAALKLLE